MTQTNPQKYWFKRRRRGWGYIPVTWQGWLTLVVTVVVIPVLAIIQLPPKPAQPTPDRLIEVFGIVALSLIAAVWLCFKKGPSPRWRWGKKPDDNPDEDF